VPESVTLTARRGSVTRNRTLVADKAEEAAQRLRAEGWTVTVGPRRNPETERAKKQRAAVIAAHRSARRARQGAEDAAGSSEADRDQ